MATKKKLKRKVIVSRHRGGTVSLREIAMKVKALNAQPLTSSARSALNRILQAA